MHLPKGSFTRVATFIEGFIHSLNSVVEAVSRLNTLPAIFTQFEDVQQILKALDVSGNDEKLSWHNLLRNTAIWKRFIAWVRHKSKPTSPQLEIGSLSVVELNQVRDVWIKVAQQYAF